MILYNGTEQWPTYLIWGLLLIYNECMYKHNHMKCNIIPKHALTDLKDDDEDDDDVDYDQFKEKN